MSNKTWVTAPKLFDTGRIYGTPGALKALSEARVDDMALLARHVTGDWSEMDKSDQRANQQAVKDGDRILSAYTLPTGTAIWVITEADRSSTTMLLPDEY